MKKPTSSENSVLLSELLPRGQRDDKPLIYGFLHSTTPKNNNPTAEWHNYRRSGVRLVLEKKYEQNNSNEYIVTVATFGAPGPSPDDLRLVASPSLAFIAMKRGEIFVAHDSVQVIARKIFDPSLDNLFDGSVLFENGNYYMIRRKLDQRELILAANTGDEIANTGTISQKTYSNLGNGMYSLELSAGPKEYSIQDVTHLEMLISVAPDDILIHNEIRHRALAKYVFYLYEDACDLDVHFEPL